jgi:hypothetical protein
VGPQGIGRKNFGYQLHSTAHAAMVLTKERLCQGENNASDLSFRLPAISAPSARRATRSAVKFLHATPNCASCVTKKCDLQG